MSAIEKGSFGEPWITGGHGKAVREAESLDLVCYQTPSPEVSARIVACVNALDGLDPAALPALIEAAKEVQERICRDKCMPHEVLSTSHHPDCMDLRRALAAFGVKQ